MAYTLFKRFTDVKSLAQDAALEVTDVLYLPVADDFDSLSIVQGEPDNPGAFSAYMDGDKVKLAVYNGDGTWSPLGPSSAISDPALPSAPTLSYLNGTYPDAKIGDIVYREGTLQVIIATCYATGKWDWTIRNNGQ